jgi:hypothetical protein
MTGNDADCVLIFQRVPEYQGSPESNTGIQWVQAPGEYDDEGATWLKQASVKAIKLITKQDEDDADFFCRKILPFKNILLLLKDWLACEAMTFSAKSRETNISNL